MSNLKDYIEEAISSGKSAFHRGGLELDDIDVGVEIEEFTAMLDRLGFEEIILDRLGFEEIQYGNMMFDERGPVYRIVAKSHNSVKVLVKVPKSEDQYYRVCFDEHTGKLKYIQRIFKNKKVGHKYLSELADIKDLIDYLK